jgi:hypothetical protein
MITKKNKIALLNYMNSEAKELNPKISRLSRTI